MRNREQIYGQEAAGLLRNITVYHCIRHDQLLRLYPGKEGVIENLLRYLVRQQRIFYNIDRDCYGDIPDCREDTGLLCDAYNTTEIGDCDCTRVSVMDKERFQGWLSDRENRLRSISDL